MLLVIVGAVASVIYGSCEPHSPAEKWTRVLALLTYAGTVVRWEYERGWPWLHDPSIGPSMLKWTLIYAACVYAGRFLGRVDNKHRRSCSKSGSP